jgi:Holliday junction resolvase RusA-like endonuclease
MDYFCSFNEIVDNNTHCLSFVVMGEPIVQKRAKISYRKTVKPVYYNPSTGNKTDWQNSFRHFLSDKDINLPIFGSDPLKDRGLQLEINFFVTRPSADFTIQKGQKKMKPSPHLYPNIKDLDNLVKFYMDAMQDIAYQNDNVICKITCSKHFTDEIQSCFITPYVIIKLQQPLPITNKDVTSSS